jgi:hypothetical protein
MRASRGAKEGIEPSEEWGDVFTVLWKLKQMRRIRNINFPRKIPLLGLTAS